MARSKDTTFDEYILEGYRKGLNFTEIAKGTPHKGDFVRNVLKRLGVYVQKTFMNTFDFNQAFGDEFPSTNPDWWLIGLLLADGSVYRRCSIHKVCIELNKKDLSGLIKIRNKYFPRGNIKKRSSRDLYSLSWQSSKLCDVLEKYGIQQNKMRKRCPDLDPILFSDYDKAMSFLSGYFDGDGCVSFSKKGGLRINITANTGVSDSLEPLLLRWGFSYSRWDNENKTYGIFTFSKTKINFQNFYRMLHSCDMVYERRIDKFRNCMIESISSLVDKSVSEKRAQWLIEVGGYDWVPEQLYGDRPNNTVIEGLQSPPLQT